MNQKISGTQNAAIYTISIKVPTFIIDCNKEFDYIALKLFSFYHKVPSKLR